MKIEKRENEQQIYIMKEMKKIQTNKKCRNAKIDWVGETFSNLTLWNFKRSLPLIILFFLHFFMPMISSSIIIIIILSSGWIFYTVTLWIDAIWILISLHFLYPKHLKPKIQGNKKKKINKKRSKRKHKLSFKKI